MIILYVLLAVVVIYLIFSVIVGLFMGNLLYNVPKSFAPSKQTVMENCIRDYGTDYESYEKWETEHFTCKNGDYVIPAEYHPVLNARGCAVVAHGFGQNRYVMVSQAQMLRDLGFSTILFDQRRFGASTAEHGSLGYIEATDVVALVNWAKERCGKETPVILIGVSMGAMSSMNALKLTNDIAAVIEDCGPSSMVKTIGPIYRSMVPIPNPLLLPCMRLIGKKSGFNMEENNPIEAVMGSNVPICIIHGDKDSGVPVVFAKEIYAACKNPNSRLEIFPGREHAYSLCDRERYRQVLTDFLATTVPTNLAPVDKISGVTT